MPSASSNQRGASASGETATPAADAFPTFSPGVEIFEDGVQVGVVDLETREFEYHGTYPELRGRREIAAERGFWSHLQGIAQLDGIGFGHQVLQSINHSIRYRPDSSADLTAVAVGFDSDYERDQPTASASRTPSRASD